MTQVRVWAPDARQLVLVCEGQAIDMCMAVNGWWEVDAPMLTDGVDYAFMVDGEGPFPDPRSAWQPHGVHGASRWLDHDHFEWHDAEWQQVPMGAAVIYECHVGTFTQDGTFVAIIDHLDHLLALGITHLELMPVAEFPGDRGWGYDGVDLYAPHHAYGGPTGLKFLVDACHRRGLAVILDVVYNHLGPSGNYLGRFGPYFTTRYATPWGEAVNLDGADSDEVRRYFIDNALMWLRDYHFDGLRLDAVHAIIDTSATHFLEQLTAEVRTLENQCRRHFILIAESDLNDPRIVRPAAVGGYGLNAQWNEDFHHALHALLTGERSGYYADFGTLADLADVLRSGFTYAGRYSCYRRRRHGRPVEGLDAHHFVACLQNHDQIGNRAMGERTSHLLTPAQLKLGAALVFFSPFVPMIFQGEEWGATTPFLYFTDHSDPALGQAVSDGRRREFAAFGWAPEQIPDPQARETFLRSRLNWDEPGSPLGRELLLWYQGLVWMRRSNPEWVNGRLDSVCVSFDEAAGWMMLSRGRMNLVCNFAVNEQLVSINDIASASILLCLCSDTEVQLVGQDIFLPAQTVAVLC